VRTRDRFPEIYATITPAWEIGRPQPALLAAFDELSPAGSVIDLGCGTGENALELARRGLEVWGLDATAAPLAKAEEKRAARGLSAAFVHGDALDLSALNRTFDMVLDCGLFHVLEDEERLRYRRSIDLVLRPGGRLLMLGLATNTSGRGPRGYSAEELRAAFAEGYQEVFLRSALFWATPDKGNLPAWLSLFIRQAT
jgi:ubiquinone/menaquinone biosynthesis C-methylase UbiE